MEEKIFSQVRTLKDWVYVWLENVLNNVVKDSTRIMYRDTMERHILPALGECTLEGLTRPLIEKWVEDLRKNPVPGTMQGVMTEGTIRNTMSVLSGCMRDAQKYGLISDNPCAETAWALPSRNLWEQRSWLDDGQIEILEKSVLRYKNKAGYPLGIGFQLVLYAGLTMSEAFALQWGNVDLEKHLLQVDYFLNEKTQKDTVEKEPLSGRKRRNVPLPDFMVERLDDVKKQYGRAEKDYVVSTDGKIPARQDQMRALLKRQSAAMGIETVTPRLLRDTYAIRAVQAGASSDMIADLMGFSSTAQVIRRYMPGKKQDRFGLVNRLYEGNSF